MFASKPDSSPLERTSLDNITSQSWFDAMVCRFHLFRCLLPLCHALFVWKTRQNTESGGYNSVQARDNNVQQDIIHRITTSLSRHTHARKPRSITALRLEYSDPGSQIQSPFITIIYSLLLMSCFSSTFASSLLDLCCFSLHLCRLSPIYISSLCRYISIVTLFSRMTDRHALTHGPVFPRLLNRESFDMAITCHLWHLRRITLQRPHTHQHLLLISHVFRPWAQSGPASQHYTCCIFFFHKKKGELVAEEQLRKNTGCVFVGLSKERSDSWRV